VIRDVKLVGLIAGH